MNLPEPSASTASPASVPPAFNWIELCAIPIAASIMETQPIVFILLCLLLSNGLGTVTALQQGGTTLLILSLRWWALIVRDQAQQGASEQHIRLLHLAGLGGALCLTVSVNIFIGNGAAGLIVAGVLVLWSWWRGIEQARADLSDEQLVTAFRLGFIILLAALILVVFYVRSLYAASFEILLAALSQELPIFFLSGVIALSFTRLNIIRKENARHTLAGTIDPTRSWLVALTIIWGAIVAAAIVLETFSFRAIQMILLPLWSTLGSLAGWLLSLLAFLLGWLLKPFDQLPSPSRPPLPQLTSPGSPRPLSPHLQQQALDPTILLIARLLLLSLIIVAFSLLIRAILERWRPVRSDNHAEEEVREGLSVGAILQARRQKQQKQRQKEMHLLLEVLDPESARAHYRSFLQTLAWHNEQAGRRSSETPYEYQQRLSLQMPPPDPREDIPSDPTILAALTEAYARERYGKRPINQDQRTYLTTWVPRLLQRLMGSPTTIAHQGPPVNQSEDKS